MGSQNSPPSDYRRLSNKAHRVHPALRFTVSFLFRFKSVKVLPYKNESDEDRARANNTSQRDGKLFIANTRHPIILLLDSAFSFIYTYTIGIG